jgi:ribonuclease HI
MNPKGLTSIIQWNLQGLRNKKYEILELIDKHHPYVLALQETKLWKSNNFTIPNYNCIRRDGHLNRTPHGGVALLIHDTIPYNEIQINSPIQAIACRTTFGTTTLTICSLYSSRNHHISVDTLNDLMQQLPSPVLILGDFNAHNLIWGCAATDGRGRIVETFANHNNLNFLNNGTVTRVGYNSESAIDLSLCSPILDPILHWSVYTSPGDSDHCPIVIAIMNQQTQEYTNDTYTNIKRAQWQMYQSSSAWSEIPDQIENVTNEELIIDLYSRYEQASTEAIPRTKRSKYFPKPWWTNELRSTRERREKLYHRYKQEKNEINLINWKRARAEHKNKVKKSKRKSWIDFVQTINRNTPEAMIYESIRRIKGRQQRKINILHDEGKYYNTIPEIAEKLAETFSTISNGDNYSPQFKQIKMATEAVDIDYESDNQEIYNRDFTIYELENALSKTKNTSPGPDGIYYQMISNMPDNARQYLLKIYNKLFKSGYFPNQWSEATIIPIPKPGKNHAVPTNYRPIALTSCLCKILERMINNRLCDYLEMNGILSSAQCGCRKHHSTIDHLVRLETEVRNAFSHGEHLIAIFYDLEKAYDTTWRFGILRDLHKCGLRGRLPKYIAAFLSKRRLRVKIDNHLSDQKDIENGVPQGSVLSVTLFAIKINQITKHIPKDPRFSISLYVDDLQVGYRSTDLTTIGYKLQDCMDNVVRWATDNGFRFSTEKTKAMRFSINPGLYLNPELKMYNKTLPYVENIKFLGLIWDTKLKWTQHIAKLKADCTKKLGLLRSITCSEWGADQYCSLKIYRMLIRSKLDYGAIVYGSACKTELQKLNTIANDALRIATGAFKSTPIDSLHAATHETPLDLRREEAALRYYYKIRCYINNPAFTSVVDVRSRLLFRNKNLTPPFAIRIQEMKLEMNIQQINIKPAFSYRRSNINIPTWALSPPKINYELNKYSKRTTPEAVYRQLYSVIRAEQYYGYTEIYTDGSKSGDGVGAAAVCGMEKRTATLTAESSIFSAETRAIELAINIIKENHNDKFAIMSDSISVLQALESLGHVHPVVRRLQHEIDTCETNGKRIELCWIPGHAGIKGNEKADELAKRAALGIPTYSPVVYTDVHTIIREKITEKWNHMWTNSNRKLRDKAPNRTMETKQRPHPKRRSDPKQTTDGAYTGNARIFNGWRSAYRPLSMRTMLR